MSLYLCVDCGGSKTSAAICDISGNIVGRGIGGPSNFAYLTPEEFISSVTVAVSNALKTCTSPLTEPVKLPPVDASPFDAAWFGVSGVDSPSAVAELTPHISTLLKIPPGPRLVVTNDIHLLASPLRIHPDVSYAVTVIAGTGSIAATLKESDGKLQELGRTGGWGWMLGDEGGGFYLGREAIRQILLEHDKASIGGPQPPHSYLATQILQGFGITDIMEILPIIHLPDPSTNKHLGPDSPPHLLMPKEKRLSSLSPLVFDAAFEHGDPLALRILRTCASHLASYIALLLSDGSHEAPRAVKAQESLISFGGSLVGIEAYRKLILDDLEQRGHVFRYVEFVGDPAAAGAVGLATSARVSRDGPV